MSNELQMLADEGKYVGLFTSYFKGGVKELPKGPKVFAQSFKKANVLGFSSLYILYTGLKSFFPRGPNLKARSFRKALMCSAYGLRSFFLFFFILNLIY